MNIDLEKFAKLSDNKTAKIKSAEVNGCRNEWNSSSNFLHFFWKSKYRNLWPFGVFLWFYLPRNSRKGKSTKLNGSKIVCTPKIQNLSAANIYGFTLYITLQHSEDLQTITHYFSHDCTVTWTTCNDSPMYWVIISCIGLNLKHV